jgi:hypothetical protein
VSDWDEIKDGDNIPDNYEQTNNDQYHHGPVWSYEAERVLKDLQKAHHEVMDRVYILPQQQGNISKCNEGDMTGIHTARLPPAPPLAPSNNRTPPLAGTRNEGRNNKWK